MTTYVSDLLGRPLAIQWQKEGDEWISHLVVALALVGITGRTLKTREPTEEVPYHHIECTPEPSNLRSRLIIIPVQSGIIVQAIAEEPVPEDLVTWISAIKKANEQLGRSQKEFNWAAVIGPNKDIEPHGQILDAATSVGPLQLRPGKVFYAEYMEARFPSLASRNSFWSWPIIVEGRARGYEWEAASRAALMDLHRLCALLSVAWDRCWVLRDTPQLREPGSTVIPKSYNGLDISEREVDRITVTAPSWADLAWNLIENNPRLANALQIHYEGRQLHYCHPSFALIAYVASVESIGTKLYQLKRCETCNTVFGSTERFRAALRLVLPENDVKHLTTAVYPRRSGTAHDGVLHGIENMFGAAFPGFFEILAPPSPTTFSWSVLREIRHANRSLLERLLSAQLSV
jgi:hypothetical protein